jgi:hypothetical protein
MDGKKTHKAANNSADDELRQAVRSRQDDSSDRHDEHAQSAKNMANVRESAESVDEGDETR